VKIRKNRIKLAVTVVSGPLHEAKNQNIYRPKFPELRSNLRQAFPPFSRQWLFLPNTVSAKRSTDYSSGRLGDLHPVPLKPIEFILPEFEFFVNSRFEKKRLWRLDKLLIVQ
jgi:hypothetical protein